MVLVVLDVILVFLGVVLVVLEVVLVQGRELIRKSPHLGEQFGHKICQKYWV